MSYSTVVQITSNNPKLLPHGKNFDGEEVPCIVTVNGSMRGNYRITFKKMSEEEATSLEKKHLLSRLFKIKKNG